MIMNLPLGRQLRVVLDQLAPGLARIASQMWAAEPAREMYLLWLRDSYHLMSATTSMLSQAVGECERRDDSASRQLVAFYAAQLGAELDHEIWILQDFAAAGGDPANLVDSVPSLPVARLTGAQYYWLRHCHPISLAGHMAVFEWYPPDQSLPMLLAQRTKLCSSAFRTIGRHISLDAQHGAELQQTLDGLSATGKQRHLLVRSAVAAADGMRELIADVTAKVSGMRGISDQQSQEASGARPDPP
jgi:hypothetical protein